MIETGEWEIWIDDVCGELAMKKTHLARRKISVVELDAYEKLNAEHSIMMGALLVHDPELLIQMKIGRPDETAHE